MARLGQRGPFRSVAPSACTAIRFALAHRTHAYEVSVIAVDRLRRRGGKISIPLHATLMTDRAPPQGYPRQGFRALLVIRDGRRRLGRFLCLVGRHAQQVAAARQLLFAVAVAQEAVVTDALEARRQHVQQEPTNEFLGV